MKARKTWVVFAVGVLVTLVATTWISVALLRVDEEQRRSQRRLRHEENMRTALWRLDVMIAPMLAIEISRDLTATSFGRLPPSSPSKFRRLDFVVGPDTKVQRRPRGVGGEEERKSLEALLQSGRIDLPSVMEPVISEDLFVNSQSPSNFSSNDLNARNIGSRRAQAAMIEQIAGGPTPAMMHPVAPAWLAVEETGAEELLLIRDRLQKDGQAFSPRQFRGVWLDWPAMKAWFQEELRDIFSECDFERLGPEWLERGGSDFLSAIPVRLVVSKPALEPISPATRTGLAAAWLAVLGVLAGLALLLHKTLSLSEKKARFAAAVTHELRTPLTTFRLYSQMLADGMVPENSRAEYIETLRAEADRLHRVVENLLVHSQVEEGSAKLNVVDVTLRDLKTALEARVAVLLEDRPGEVTWEVSADLDAKVTTDLSAVEQIATNLVENALKYGALEGDATVELSMSSTTKEWHFICRDRGPGVPAEARSSIFEAFDRGRDDRVLSEAGVGLGLTISRGLARDLGGELSLLDEPGTGATFLLTLPR